LLLSPIAWHNYSMLLWPGVLVVLAAGRRGMAATMLALAVIPVSWNEVLPPDGPVAAIGRSLYCAILLSYWLVLLALVRSSSTLDRSPGVDGATIGVPRVGEVMWKVRQADSLNDERCLRPGSIQSRRRRRTASADQDT
jgi:hypothetical protein